MSTIKVNNVIPPNVGEGVKIDGLQMPTDGPLSNRNLIINGSAAISQRGTSFTVTSGYCVDRFNYSLPVGAFTVTQSSEAPTGFAKSIKLDCTSAGTPAGNDENYLEQSIEAQNLQHLAFGTASAKQLAVSFWVKSNKTGDYGLWVYQEDASMQCAVTYNIATANTWEYKTLVIPGNTAGSINNDNGRGLIFRFYLAAGSTYAGTPSGAWTTTTTSNRTTNLNLADSTSNEWFLTGLQVEVGSKATPFEHRSYGDELQRCQRYCQVLGGDSYKQLGGAMRATTTTAKGQLKLVTTMRATPTGSTVGSGSFRFQSGDDILSGDVDFTSLWTAGSDHNVIWADWAPGTGTFGGSAKDYGMLWCNNGATRKLILSAEL